MKRCKWCNLNNPKYVEYHDNEWCKLNKNDKVFINGYIEANVVKVKCINVWK